MHRGTVLHLSAADVERLHHAVSRALGRHERVTLTVHTDHAGVITSGVVVRVGAKPPTPPLGEPEPFGPALITTTHHRPPLPRALQVTDDEITLREAALRDTRAYGDPAEAGRWRADVRRFLSQLYAARARLTR